MFPFHPKLKDGVFTRQIIMKYDEKDVPLFRKDVCCECVCFNYCLDKDNHWFLMCPKYFNWKMGCKTYISEMLNYQRNYVKEDNDKKTIKNKKGK